MSSRPIASPGELLRRHGLAPKKSWGQNFLHDPTVHRDIVAEVGDAPCDVIEIGPGLGTLTAHLLAAGHRVTAVERDRDMCTVLRDEFTGVDRFTLIEGDAVTFDYGASCYAGYTIVGNLPYQLTGPLLFRLLEFSDTLGCWIVMVQREVADRLCAPAGTRQYGASSVSLSRLRAIAKVRHVPRGAFLPPPRVESAVLRLDRRLQPLGEVTNALAFQRLVQLLFQRRRKTLLNALGAVVGRDHARQWCDQLGIDSNLRPERLTAAQFAALARLREKHDASVA